MKQHRTTNSVQTRSNLSSVVHPSSEYRTVFESLLIGTFVLIVTISILLFISYFVFHNTYVIGRIFTCAAGLIYLAIAYIIWVRGSTRFASRLLVIFYFAIASLVVLGWGVNTPFGLLIFAIGIILAGILLGSRHTLYAAGTAITLLFALQMIINLNKSPFIAGYPSHFGDAAAYSILLAILALIAWLFGRQTEHLLLRNYQAEQALLREKLLLESRVRERTEELRKAQLNEMEQLYQFAEVGQLSTALLHDFANHLSVLNFDIADLKKHQYTQAVRNVEESIGYLEQIIGQVRKQLQGKSEMNHFNVVDCLKESITINTPKAATMSVILVLKAPKKEQLTAYGDSLRFSHIVNILIQNAIEAYEKNTSQDRTITIIAEQSEKAVTIRVRNNGNAIPPDTKELIFTPLQSTKKDGLGIGLFIAKKITETHFRGTLTLSDTTEYTEFVIELPKVSHGSNQ